MNRTRFISLSAAVSLAYGAAALVAPAALTGAYGVALDRSGLFLVQFLGASYIGYAIIDWLTRASSDSVARRGVALGNAVAWTLGIVVSGAGMLSGLAAPLGWSVVALAVLFAAGWIAIAVTPTDSRVREPGLAS